jgi:tRNA(Ile)-lysidine synthase
LILSRAAENIALDYGYLSQKGEEAFKTIGKFKNDQVIIILKLLKEFHPALQKQICRLAIQKIKGGLEKIEEKHYNLFLDLIKYRHLRTIDLPSDILVVKKDDKITFSKMVRQTRHLSGSMNSPSLEPSRAKSRENHPERSRGKTRLKIPGKTNLPNFNLVISAKLLKSVNVSKIKHKKSPLVEYLDYGQLKKPIFIRFRQKGDKFQPLGMKGVKSLKKFFIDEKIPLKKRNTIPLVTDKKDIIWVAGQRISQKAKITPQTKHILKLTLLKNKLPK